MGTVIHDLRRLVGFPEPHWRALCADMVSAARPEALHRARRMLVLRQGLYLPVGAAAEDIYRVRDLWTYAVLVAALGKSDVPKAGVEWLQTNQECWRALRLSRANPPAGVIAEIMQRAETKMGKAPARSEAQEVIQEPDGDVPASVPAATAMVDASTMPESRPGMVFIEWLREGIASGSVLVNVPGARVHVVHDGVLIVSPGAFKDFDADRWQQTQNEVLALRLHKAGESSNFRSYKVAGTAGAFVRGVLLRDQSVLFNSEQDCNPSLEEAS